MFLPTNDTIHAYLCFPNILKSILKYNEPFDPYRRSPSLQDWSPVEIVCHLRDSEMVALDRTLNIRKSSSPILEAFDQDEWAVEKDYISSDFRKALEDFIDFRSQHVKILKELNEFEWSLSGQHTEVGQISIYNHITRMLAHDVIHLDQIIECLSGNQ